MPVSDEARKLKNKARASLTLLLVAVISITTATYAWFTLSNSASVQSMEVKVGTGTKLMVSTTSKGSTNWDDYKATLDNDDVNAALQRDYSYHLSDIRLWPLTSGNGYTLYTQQGNGDTPKKGAEAKDKGYLELELWFMSSVKMDVYLNEGNSAAGEEDGTKLSSKSTNNTAQAPVDRAVRVSFTSYSGSSPEKSVIYEPNRSENTTLTGNAKSDNNGGATQPTFVNLGDNTGVGSSEVLFSLEADTPKRVVLRLWIEGEDPQCVNGNGTGSNAGINLEKADLLARFRFCGADSSGKFIENTVA